MIAEIVHRVRLGDHVCALAATPDDLIDAAAGMITVGLRSNEQVMVFTDALRPAQLHAGLRSRGLDVETAAREGQVRLIPAREAYAPDGRFDGRRMLASVHRYVEDAAASGFAGLRLLGDVAWVPGTPAEAEHLAWYEAQLNTIYMEARALGVCLYHPHSIDPGLLQRVISAHPATSHQLPEGASWSPLLQIRRTADPHGVQLIGECDLSNRASVLAAVEAALRDRLDPHQPVIIDVARLRFADAATGAFLLELAQGSPPEAALVGVSGTVATLIEALRGAH